MAVVKKRTEANEVHLGHMLMMPHIESQNRGAGNGSKKVKEGRKREGHPTDNWQRKSRSVGHRRRKEKDQKVLSSDGSKSQGRNNGGLGLDPQGEKMEECRGGEIRPARI